ncbi:MAG TPA: carbohydrate ABC transporter permease, partial [Micromonosporaceae bacterium]
LRFRGRAALFATVLAVLAVPGVVLLIPKFLVLNQLGIYNSYAGLILPMLVDAAGVFIMKQAFESVPVTVEEAARIDGAGIFRTYWSVVLPMVRPALIALVILSFQGSWNELPHTLVAVQSPELYTLPRGLADLVSGSLGAGTQFPLKLGAALLATIPVAVIFVIFQRHFVRGANEGGVKG